MKLKNIEWKNIFHMMCYAVDELKHFNPSKVGDDDLKGTHDLLATLLCYSFELVNDNGYIKRYNTVEVLTDRPYGMINLEKSMMTGEYYRGNMYCNVNQLDINNKYNQIIKLAFSLLIDSNNIIDGKIDSNLMTRLISYRSILSKVSNIEPDVSLLELENSIPEWYKPIYVVCSFIINNWLAKDADGKHSLLSLNDQSILKYIFEKFLREYYKNNHTELSISKHALSFDNGDYVIPDIIIVDDVNSRIIVMDAKWYEKEKFSNSNLAELSQNCSVIMNDKTLGSKYTVKGINVYASTNKLMIKPPRKINISNILYTDSFMALDRTWEEIEDELEWILNEALNLTEFKDIKYMV